MHAERIEQMYQEMRERTPRYELSKRVIASHIDLLQRVPRVFLATPETDGQHLHLAEAIEQRCVQAVIRELRKCSREIDEHLERLAEIEASR